MKCKQPEKVLILMKASFTIFWFITLCVTRSIACSNIKQNLSHAWSLGPHTLNKLILQFISLSIKQNLSHARSLGPNTLGKLILLSILLSIKHNFSYTWSLGPHTLGKLILQFFSLSIKQNLSHIGLSDHILWVN